MSKSENYLIVSDLQIPFEHHRALRFCAELRKEYNVKDENIYSAGDELDQNWAGLYKKDPDALHTPQSEIARSILTMKEWYDVFPQMKVCASNHGNRVAKLAFDAGIPSIMMRRYQEVIQAPPGWKWAQSWKADCKYPFKVEHGDKRGYGSSKPHVMASLRNGMSTVIGHYHSKAGVEWIETEELKCWAAASGCLIDRQSYAFYYSRNDAEIAKIGATVVLDGGRYAVWIPL